MKGAGAHFHVVRLQQHAAAGRPVLLQREDQVLEGGGSSANFSSRHGVLAVPDAQMSAAVYRLATEREPPATGAQCCTISVRVTVRCTNTSALAGQNTQVFR